MQFLEAGEILSSLDVCSWTETNMEHDRDL
jgi:hypothetical protein